MQPMTETRPLQLRLRQMIDIPQLLRTMPAFGSLNDREIAELAHQMGVQAFVQNQTIFHQGDVDHTLYLIARGQVRIYHTSATNQKFAVALYQSGDLFGELVPLADQPDSTSAVAICPTITLLLGREAFRQLLRDHPAVEIALLRELATRLRASATAGYNAQETSVSPLVGTSGVRTPRRASVRRKPCRLPLRLWRREKRPPCPRP